MLVLNADTGVSAVQDNAVNPTTDIASGIPCFRANRTATQVLALSNTLYKVQVNTVEFDTTNAYDETTNYRFQPTRAGYYNCLGGIHGIGTSSTQAQYAIIRKNGNDLNSGIVRNGSYQYVGTNYVDGVSRTQELVYLNGTTDYLELWAGIIGAGSLEVRSAIFSAHLIVGA